MLSRSLPACPDERLAFRVLLRPGPLADEQPFGVGIADAGNAPDDVRGKARTRCRRRRPRRNRAIRAPRCALRGCPGTATRAAATRAQRASPVAAARHARSFQTGASPSSNRISSRVGMRSSGFRSRHRVTPDGHDDRAPHDERVFADRAFGERRVVGFAASHGREPLGGIQRNRASVRHAHFEEDLLGAEAARIVDESAQQLAPQALPPRVRHHRQIQDLRFAGGQHQHAVGDDAPFAHADARAIAGGKRIAEIAGRPRRRVNLRLERGNVRDIALLQRTPLGHGGRESNGERSPSPGACAKDARPHRARPS